MRAPTEVCDGSETGTCGGACLPNCTCAETCGDGIVQAGEACDGSGCVPEDPNGCFPPGSSNECQCCASASPCYVRGFGNPTPIEVPCCTGVCEIPGPEAGPDVMVYCSEPPPASCPCWTSASLDAQFPPGFFDELDRGGAQCDVEPTVASVTAVDFCTFRRLSGVEFTVPRGGAGVIGNGLCAVFEDLDPENTGQCFGPPRGVQTITPQEAAACIAELLASQVYQRECP